MGDEIRAQYPGLASRALLTALGRRVKSVQVSHKAVRTWISKYRASSSTALPVIRKRPAAVLGASDRVRKRPASAASVGSMAAPAALSILLGGAGIEEACGERYRREVSDLGLGTTERDMRQRLKTWGYDSSREACWNWLQRYRVSSSAKDGCATLYQVYMHDLQHWYHVEQKSPSELQEALLQVHGIYANRANCMPS